MKFLFFKNVEKQNHASVHNKKNKFLKSHNFFKKVYREPLKNLNINEKEEKNGT